MDFRSAHFSMPLQNISLLDKKGKKNLNVARRSPRLPQGMVRVETTTTTLLPNLTGTWYQGATMPNNGLGQQYI